MGDADVTIHAREAWAAPTGSSAPSPLFGLRLAVPVDRSGTVEFVVAATGGRAVIVRRHEHPMAYARQFQLHTDGEVTLRRLHRELRARLGSHLIDLADPVFARAERGKLAQRVTIPLSGTDDLALIHPSADARIRAHLAENPDDVDRYTMRRHRVALLSDASALPAGTDPAAALVGLESTALFLHHHSGLEITSLPVDARQDNLTDLVAALSPGFAAMCLHHTSAENAEAVRRRLTDRLPVVPVLDTSDDATAVTVVAALLNAVRQAGATMSDQRVLVIDGQTAPAIGALLTAAGIRNLSFADSRGTQDAAFGDRHQPYDVLIDLSSAGTGPPDRVHRLAPPRVVVAMSSAARDPEPGSIVMTGRPGPHQLHPLLALPGLLSAAVHRRISMDVTLRLAAAQALAGLAPPGRLLPDPLDQSITATIHAAVTAPPRPQPR